MSSADHSIPIQSKISSKIADEAREVLRKGDEQEHRMYLVSAGEISPFEIMETPFQKTVLSLSVLWHPEVVLSVNWIDWGYYILTLEPPTYDDEDYVFARNAADTINAALQEEGFDVARLKAELVEFEPEA